MGNLGRLPAFLSPFRAKDHVGYGKKAFRLLILLLICGGFMSWAAKNVEIAKFPYWTAKFSIMVIAHRGFSGAAPENTLAAFQKGIEIGSDMIELDVHLSRDGEIVVIHDETLERTTNGKGMVADQTLQDLKRLDAGSSFGPAFAGEKIPILREVLDLAKGRVLVNIEIKNPTHQRYSITELAEKTLREVEKAGMIDKIIFSSFNPASLEWIGKKEPRAQTAFLFHRPWNSLRDIPGSQEYSVLNLRNIHLTREKVAELKKAGKRVNVYTVNPEEEIRKFVDWGVDGIITNYPDRLIKVLQKP
jgi:glycerophosphoryl diester phosphodiesterase